MRFKIFSLVFLSLFLASSVFAETEDYDALYDINQPLDYQLMSSSSSFGTYSDVDYYDGLFDRYLNIIDYHNFPSSLIDNKYASNDGLIKETYSLVFTKPLTITGYYNYMSVTHVAYQFKINFYNSSNVLLATEVLSGPEHKYKSIVIEDVFKIEFFPVKGTSNARSFGEIEFFIDPSSLYASVIDLAITKLSFDSATFKWTNSNSVTGNRIYLDDVLIYDGIKINNFYVKNLLPSTNYKLTVSALYDDIEVFKHYDFLTVPDPGDITPPDNVKVLNLTPSLNEVDLSFSASISNDLSHYQIYRNGLLVKDNLKELNYVDDGLEEYTTYIYKVVAVDKSGNASSGISKTVRTLTSADMIAPDDVINLKVVEDYTATSSSFSMGVIQLNAKLTYDFPSDDDFSHVVIARDNVILRDDIGASSFLDLRLDERTKYKYTVYAVDETGNRSSGVSVYLNTTFIPDAVAPAAPFLLSVTKGNVSGRADWKANEERDIDGYNVYLDGVKVNNSLVKSATYLFRELVNGQSYSVSITAVDWSGNESAQSNVLVLTPDLNAAPIINLEASYDLKDVADSTSNWFSSLWWIVAFVIGIFVSFILSRRIKNMFVGD